LGVPDSVDNFIWGNSRHADEHYGLGWRFQECAELTVPK